MATTRQSWCPMDLEETYTPFASPQLDDPYPVWERARHEQPVFHSRVPDAWVVTRYDDVVRVLRDQIRFHSVAQLKMFGTVCPEAAQLLDELPAPEETTLLSSEPPVHTKLRRYLQPAFMPRNAALLEPKLWEIGRALIDGFEARGHGDFYRDYVYPYPLSVVCHLLGLPEEHHEQVKEWAGLRLKLRYADLSADEQLSAARAAHDYYAYALDLVGRRRAEPGDDIMSWIIADSDASDDPLTEEQLAQQAISLLTAGHETMALWLTIGMRRLLEDRPRWTALVADPSSSGALVEESLRMDGPVQSIWRTAVVDVEVGGVTIPAGSRVSVVLGSANADETTFEVPRSFHPERPNASRHVAFGHGIHTCVGNGIARMEGRISFELLARRLPELRLAADPGFAFEPSATTRMTQHLNVEWTSP